MQTRTILGLLIALILCFSGCDELEKRPTQLKEKYKYRTEPSQAVHFEYQGHQYIFFVWDAGGDHREDKGCGYIHDPDCQMCKK